jgi:tRNA 2-thiouridine synthesizing protein A
MPVVEISETVDARGLSCPMPIVKTAQAVKALPSGAVIELLATDAGSIKDVAAWCRSTGNGLIEQSSDGAVYRFVIRRK